MGFYDSEDGIRQYMQLAEGYDGREIINKLKNYLEPGSTVLEVGMGPGIDLDILAEDYAVTGSDQSQVFLGHYKKKNPDADLIILDAVKMNTDQQFDCIFSNKVLHHVTKEEMVTSLGLQAQRLNPRGILCHTFWRGEKEETHEGMRFVHYLEDELKNVFNKHYDVLEIEKFREMGLDDSLYVIARVKD